MKRKVLTEIICLLFILLFVYAAVAKLLDFERFKVQIAQSPLLTDFSGFVAVFIPVLEIAVAVLLAVPKYRLAGLLCSFGLMVMFTTYIISILQFSEHIPCACGGVLQNLGWSEHLIFNLFFTLVAIVGVSFQRQILKGQNEYNLSHG